MKTAVFVLSILLTCNGFAQQKPTSAGQKKAPQVTNPQIPKPSTEENVSADKYFNDKNYLMALSKYLDEIKKTPDDKNMLNKIGVCYLETYIDKKSAIDYFVKALKAGYTENTIALNLGRAYLFAEAFDSAALKFEQYKNLEFRHQDNVEVANKYISFCNNGKLFKAHTRDITFENLGDAVNSNKADYFPLIDDNEKLLIFNSNRQFISDFGEYITSVYSADFKGKWKKAKSISSKINTNDNEYLVGSSPNIDALVVRPETYDHVGDIMISNFANKQYDTPVLLGEPINMAKSLESSGCLSPSGDTLYFASNREGGSGGFDLYYSIKIGTEWGIPQNLGLNINTPYNDENPSLSRDGSTLYFASEGHNSMGGFDLFSCKYKPETQSWGDPQNLGYPINSTYDDYSIAFTKNSRYAYVAAVRDGGFGDYDIYKITINDEEQPYIAFTGMVAVGDTATAVPLIQLTNKANVVVTNKTTNALIGSYPLTKSGKYLFSLPPGKYSLSISAEGFVTYTKYIDVADKAPESTLIVSDIYMKKE